MYYWNVNSNIDYEPMKQGAQDKTRKLLLGSKIYAVNIQLRPQPGLS